MWDPHYLYVKASLTYLLMVGSIAAIVQAYGL